MKNNKILAMIYGKVDFDTFIKVYEEIKKETLAKIKRSPIKLSIRNMVNWKKINQELNIR